MKIQIENKRKKRMAEEEYPFEEIEKNNERCLTPEEIEKVDQAFQAFDKDNNGYIDADELKGVLESICHVLYKCSDGTKSN